MPHLDGVDGRDVQQVADHAAVRRDLERDAAETVPHPQPPRVVVGANGALLPPCRKGQDAVVLRLGVERIGRVRVLRHLDAACTQVRAGEQDLATEVDERGRGGCGGHSSFPPMEGTLGRIAKTIFSLYHKNIYLSSDTGAAHRLGRGARREWQDRGQIECQQGVKRQTQCRQCTIRIVGQR